MTVTPGVIPIASKMLILEKPIPGYNNVLTMATKDMSFGVNKNLNYSPPVRTSTENTTTTPVSPIKNEGSEKETTLVSFQLKTTSPVAATLDSHEKELVYVFSVILTAGVF